MDKYFNDKFRKIPENQYSNGFKMGYNKFENHKVKDSNLSYIKTVEEFLYCFKGLEQIKYSTSTGKLFMYAVSFLENSNVAKFYANDYIKLRDYTTSKEGLKRLKDDLLQLARIEGVRYQNKSTWIYANIIISAKIIKKYVYIEFNQEFVEFIKQMYFWLPNSLFKTQDQYAPHSWSIGYELFKYIKSNKHARQQKTFTRNIESLIKYSGLQHAVNTERQKEYLFTPFIKSLKHLNEVQDTIEIEIPEYTNNFKDKKITITVKDNQLLDCYKVSTRKTIEENKSKKAINTIKAIELNSQGYTINAIALDLKVSTRTVKRYLKQ